MQIYGFRPRPGLIRLKFIVVDLDPVTVRVLEVDLLDLVRPQLRGLGVLRPIPIFDIHRIEVFREFLHRWHAKGQMDIDVVGNILFCARDHMQLAMLRDPEPHMLAVVERLGYPFEFQYLFIEIRRPVEVRYINGLMAEMRALG